MQFQEYRYMIISDLYRITGNKKISAFFHQILFGISYKYTFWMRTSQFSRSHRFLKITLFPFARLMHRHYTFKFGISIPAKTSIGSGFYIGHFGGIVINHRSRIGRNCNISHGVTLGQSNRGKNKGYPILGDNIYIGPGAKIIGAVRIGNNVAIGANCVVTKDIPDNAVVTGIPGKVISQNGASGYINNIDYDRVPRSSTSISKSISL